MKEKTFYKILLEFSFSIEKTKRRLSDLRLTQTEKLIIEGHLNIRKNLNQEVIDSFSGISPQELPFVESQRLLLIGAALNNLTHYNKAEKYVLNSLEILNKLDAPYFIFYANHTLFSIYDNLCDTKSMHRTLEHLRKVKKTKRQDVLLLICEFCYEQQMENYSKARTLSDEIDHNFKDLTEGDITRHLVNKFMFFAQQEDLNSAKLVFKELKQCRNYMLTESYNFIKKLLDNITEGSPLYIYDHQFKNAPLLLHQLKVIQGLEEKNFESARSHWEELKTFDPKAYGENFQYNSPTCIFSIALKKHLSLQAKPLEFKEPVGASKLEQLISILSDASSPVPAALIHELLWGNPPETKEDLKKVSRLISRAKLDKNLTINYHKGTYFLVNKIIASKIS